jgi:hypothetical protein
VREPTGLSNKSNESPGTGVREPVTRRAERGFVLLDALLCLFISGIIFGIIVNSQAVQRRALAEVTKHAGQLIEERNRIDGKRVGIDEGW